MYIHQLVGDKYIQCMSMLTVASVVLLGIYIMVFDHCPEQLVSRKKFLSTHPIHYINFGVLDSLDCVGQCIA